MNVHRVRLTWPFAAAIGAGCRYGYKNLRWDEDSPVWEFAGAKGLYLYNFDGAIQVNMLGKRFYNEEAQNGFYSDDDGMWDYFAACFGSVILDEGTPEARRVGGPCGPSSMLTTPLPRALTARIPT